MLAVEGRMQVICPAVHLHCVRGEGEMNLKDCRKIKRLIDQSLPSSSRRLTVTMQFQSKQEIVVSSGCYVKLLRNTRCNHSHDTRAHFL